MTALQIDPKIAWQAVSDRDERADGEFVYAVLSTGVYCRPTCPARRPKRANVRFFASPVDARRAGYRACRRCQPDESASAAERLVEAARNLIDDDQPARLAD